MVDKERRKDFRYVMCPLRHAFGLYDMTGNVWEWCNDWYGSYGSGAMTNPIGAVSGSARVLRGGSWYSDGDFLFRSANRNNNNPDNRNNNDGFRCVLPRHSALPESCRVKGMSVHSAIRLDSRSCRACGGGPNDKKGGGAA
jgi:hypothetical protein